MSNLLNCINSKGFKPNLIIKLSITYFSKIPYTAEPLPVMEA